MIRFESAAPITRLWLIGVALVVLVSLGVIGATLIALAGLGQLSSDIDLGRLPAWLWYYREDPELRRWLLIGALCSAGLILSTVVAALLNRKRPLHGAARWASATDQARAGLRARSGILLGRSGGALLIADGVDHAIVYAPTRTGKGVGVVIPNLLTWPGSVVALDIKRENHEASAGYRAACGQTVHLFDPLAADGRTARYNPLGHIDRNDPNAVIDELQRMAAMLFPGHDHADPFWSEAARTGFVGVGAYVAQTSDLPFSLGEVFRQLTQGDARARFPEIVKARRQTAVPLSPACASALEDFCASSENTFSSVRQTITSRMGLWLNPLVDAATEASDFDLRELRGGRTSLYLAASPDNLVRVAPLYSLVFQQLVDLNSRRLAEPSDQPVLVLLDEFARLGRAPVLAHAFSYIAAYGLRLLPVIQSPSQLRALYGPDVAEEIMTNCGIEVVFAPKELKIAQELSERLGYTTVTAHSRSRPMGLGAGRRSVTTSAQRRALMLAQELMQLPPHNLIVLKAGVPPVRGTKIVFYRERAFIRRRRPAPIPTPISMPDHPRPNAARDHSPQTNGSEDRTMDYDTIVRDFIAEGCPPPPVGAGEDEVGDWLDRVIDAALTPSEMETDR